MRNEALFDYMNIIDQTPPPGAEGANQGNGSASEYFNTSPDTNNVPVESQLNPEEQKILKEAAKKDKRTTRKRITITLGIKEKRKAFSGGYLDRRS
jgi:penicillin-binding protein 1A